MMEAVEQGVMEIAPHNGGEQYIFKSPKGQIPCDELGVYLDLLGGVGYYQKGPDMAVSVCLQGVSQESERMVASLKSIKTKAFDEEMTRLQRAPLKKSPHIQWFHVENRFNPMGVKMVGLFCEAIRDANFVDPDKYIAGFQIIPNEIPGFGPITFDQVKISMRVPLYLEEEIRVGKAMGLDKLLPEATNRVGGFSDACHSLTAATTVAIGKEGALIQEMEQILGG